MDYYTNHSAIIYSAHDSKKRAWALKKRHTPSQTRIRIVRMTDMMTPARCHDSTSQIIMYAPIGGHLYKTVYYYIITILYDENIFKLSST